MSFDYNYPMEKILIVDGSNLLFQMFYGIPKKIYNSQGDTIHATIGFIGAMFRMVNMVNPEYISVIFDSETPSERVLWDENYKANRIKDWDSLPRDEVPFYELDNIKKALNLLHIHFLETKNREADDVISSLVRQFQDQYEIVISSFDSDFFQLLNERVKILHYRGKQTSILDQELFYEKFGFYPDKYVFYKALKGDAADNIPGLPKIGTKRASALVKQYSDYEEILKDINNVQPQCIRESIRTGSERFCLNWQLIDLLENEKADWSVTDLTYDHQPFQESSTMLLRKANIF